MRLCTACSPFAPAQYCTRSHTSRRKYRVWEEGPVALALCLREGLLRGEYSRAPRAGCQRSTPEFIPPRAAERRDVDAFPKVTRRGAIQARTHINFSIS